MFHSEPKITLFHLLSFVFNCFTTCCHSLSIAVSLVVNCCHSLSFVVTRLLFYKQSLGTLLDLITVEQFYIQFDKIFCRCKCSHNEIILCNRYLRLYLAKQNDGLLLMEIWNTSWSTTFCLFDSFGLLFQYLGGRYFHRKQTLIERKYVFLRYLL